MGTAKISSSPLKGNDEDISTKYKAGSVGSLNNNDIARSHHLTLANTMHPQKNVIQPYGLLQRGKVKIKTISYCHRYCSNQALTPRKRFLAQASAVTMT
ncbi:hypothetical protein DPMN_109263 [Dreissena polymorpha]|uniref:Uncharacterized protein n=1 Tax=Dreissena polymorpha TaxID=45954 RepID=A0A9D4K9Z2_DREPO|nr:hypothetical protein DPMN_109263 [Dreissena polymorpha]